MTHSVDGLFLAQRGHAKARDKEKRRVRPWIADTPLLYLVDEPRIRVISGLRDIAKRRSDGVCVGPDPCRIDQASEEGALEGISIDIAIECAIEWG
jgi:hypothetical protein